MHSKNIDSFSWTEEDVDTPMEFEDSKPAALKDPPIFRDSPTYYDRKDPPTVGTILLRTAQLQEEREGANIDVFLIALGNPPEEFMVLGRFSTTMSEFTRCFLIFLY